MKEAELAARNELQPLVAGYSKNEWQEAVGSGVVPPPVCDLRVTPSAVQFVAVAVGASGNETVSVENASSCRRRAAAI